MKQTAVEWLEEKFNNNNANFINWSEDYFNEAKDMEKQQIIDAWEDGQNSFPTINAKQYYKETFNNK